MIFYDMISYMISNKTGLGFCIAVTPDPSATQTHQLPGTWNPSANGAPAHRNNLRSVMAPQLSDVVTVPQVFRVPRLRSGIQIKSALISNISPTRFLLFLSISSFEIQS